MELKTLYVIRETPDWLLTRVKHLPSGMYMMAKTIHPNAPDASSLAVRLREEYEFMQSLEHDFFLQVKDWSDSPPRILYEDVQGTLDQLIQQVNRIAPDLVANLLKESAQGLQYLHSRKLGHGSLGTNTMFVSPNGSVKSGSFIGYRFDPQAQPPMFDPTTKCQPPEMISQGMGACTPTSDLYCLGFAALEALAGHDFESLFGVERRDPSSGAFNWLAWHGNPTRTLTGLEKSFPDLPKAILAIVEMLIVKEEFRRGYRKAGDLLKAVTEFGVNSQRRLPAIVIKSTEDDGESDGDAKPKKEGRPTVLILTSKRDGEQVRDRFQPKTPTLVGRGDKCQFSIDDQSISSKHALLCWQAGTWWVYDLNSTVGTFVNRKKVTHAPLKNKTVIQFGRARYIVSLEDYTAIKREKVETLGKFILEKELFNGSNGKLYLAKWNTPDGLRPVALRVFPPDFGYNVEQIQRFMRGNPTAGEIHHPNIVRLYRGGSFKPNTKRGRNHITWYLAMEYMAGGSLRDRIHKKQLTASEAIRCGLDIVQALKEANRRQLLHRNIRPSCILFAADGTAKLGDFSLLRGEVLDTIQNITQQGLPPGEYCYQAPEMIEGGDLSIACDIYGLAASLYEGLTGEAPVPHMADLPAQMRAILRTKIKPLNELRSDLPTGLVRAIMKALERNPNHRYESPEDFEEALRVAKR